MGHQQTRQHLYWFEKNKDVLQYVRHSHRCVFSKTREPKTRVQLGSIEPSQPLELACIGFCSAENSSNRSVDALVVRKPLW